MTKRVSYDIVAFLSVFYTPWWCVVVIACVGALLFPRYYEILFMGFIIDLLYGVDTSFLRGTLGLAGSVILLIAFSRLREMIR